MRASVTRRIAFTLIELLVVIAIIGILVALVGAAVLNVLKKGPQVQTANEVSQFSVAMQSFNGRFKVNPPSKIRLRNKLADYDINDPLDKDSKAYILQFWNRIGPVVDWSGGQGMTATDAIVLEGDQCLVFFLGGIPTAANPTAGFSKDPSNPTSMAGDRERFFEFNAAQLFKRGNPYFYSYADKHNTGAPYVYFSSGKRSNGYHTPSATPVYPAASDCGLIPAGPYYLTLAPIPSFLRPDSYQIISAGADGTFGAGGVYNSSTPPAANSPAYDDQANFGGTRLGDGQ